jgi:hypothetical protein
MKTFINIAVIGILIIYMLIGFVQWEWNPGSWDKGIRAMFAIFTVGWIMIAVMVRAGIEEFKAK